MSSPRRNRHLDATQGREVVYCHSCRNEWYQDEDPGALHCPACHDDFIEVISSDNDPRDMDDDLPGLTSNSDAGHHFSPPRRDSAADPDEADINDHTFFGPAGLFGRRSIHRNPTRSGNQQGYGDPGDILRNFEQMVQGLGGSPFEGVSTGRSGRETIYGNQSGGGPHVVQRTFRAPNFNGEVSTVTITSGFSSRPRAPSDGARPNQGPRPGDDPFARLFSELLGNIGGPPHMRGAAPDPFGRAQPEHDHEREGDADHRQGDFPPLLSQLLGQILNPHGVHGDGVYTQEALDRIMTNLMENNPLSNAPAPASHNAIQSLPKKKLDEEMTGPELKGECTICIDEVPLGEEVVVLPCNHWFHEECASLWLKQHNSCPVCRAPIDGESAGRPRTTASANSGPSGAPQPSSPSTPSPSSRRRANLSQRGEDRLNSIRGLAGTSPYQSSRRDRPRNRSRSASESDRDRDNRSSGSGPINWFRDRFSGR